MNLASHATMTNPAFHSPTAAAVLEPGDGHRPGGAGRGDQHPGRNDRLSERFQTDDVCDAAGGAAAHHHAPAEAAHGARGRADGDGVGLRHPGAAEGEWDPCCSAQPGSAEPTDEKIAGVLSVFADHQQMTAHMVEDRIIPGRVDEFLQGRLVTMGDDQQIGLGLGGRRGDRLGLLALACNATCTANPCSRSRAASSSRSPRNSSIMRAGRSLGALASAIRMAGSSVQMPNSTSSLFNAAARRTPSRSALSLSGRGSQAIMMR